MKEPRNYPSGQVQERSTMKEPRNYPSGQVQERSTMTEPRNCNVLILGHMKVGLKYA